MNQRGQALLESVPFFVVTAGLLAALILFTQWFLLHQKMLIAARQGALLYSSGRLTPSEVEKQLRRYLSSGSVPLANSQLTIAVGRWRGHALQSRLLRLDEVRIRYVPASRLLRFFQPTQEERCVIKHAPHYGPPYQTLQGPPFHGE